MQDSPNKAVAFLNHNLQPYPKLLLHGKPSHLLVEYIHYSNPKSYIDYFGDQIYIKDIILKFCTNFLDIKNRL